MLRASSEFAEREKMLQEQCNTVSFAALRKNRKINGPLLQKVLEFMARDEQENAAKFPGNGQVVDLASPIRPGPHGLTRKSLI